MRTSLLAMMLWAATPSRGEPDHVDVEAQLRDVATLLAEIAAVPEESPARARLCADARSSTHDVDLPEAELDKLRAECPSWFPVPAAPDFCRATRCAADFSWVH